MASVFIPTRERHFHLEKSLPKWAAKEAEVVLVVDPRDRKATEKFIEDGGYDAEVFSVSKNGIGIGAIRQEILESAIDRSLESFIIADDDLVPAKGDIRMLTDAVIDENVVGCGASNSGHGLMLGKNGNEILKLKESFPIAGVWGHCLFALNTELAEAAGGYPRWCTCFGEDAELQRQGIAMGYPWWYESAVTWTSLAKRYSPGGLEAAFNGSKEKRIEAENKVRVRLAKRWPDYVSAPPKPHRTAWKKMMNDYIPDWRDRIPAEVRLLMEAK